LSAPSLGLWLAVGIAWGARAALLFGFQVFIASVFAAWAILAGRLTQRAGAAYYERQMRFGTTGRWHPR
jgi:hypothetical protein